MLFHCQFDDRSVIYSFTPFSSGDPLKESWSFERHPEKGRAKELVNEACSAPNHHSNYLGNPIQCSCRVLASCLDSLLNFSVHTLPNKFSTLSSRLSLFLRRSSSFTPTSSFFSFPSSSRFLSLLGPTACLLSFLPTGSLTLRDCRRPPI
mgnify:CR=1 FL=1